MSSDTSNANRSLLVSLRELIATRELFYRWVRREFGVRYSQSFFGVAWSVLQPLALMLIFSLVFSVFLRMPTGDIPYPVFAYCALLPWTFFATALSTAQSSLVTNVSLVSKIYFPREILPLASIVVGFLDFLIASSVFVVMLVVYQITIGPAVLFIPLIMLVQLTLTTAISLFVSALTVFYRDIRFLVPLALQLWLYLSPVIYPIAVVPERFQSLYFLNPMAVILEGYRRAIFFNQPPDWPYFALAAGVSITLLFAAYRYFKRAETRFADLI